MCEKCTIKEKEVLDLAWKYFQQHAQQRIGYFNFFVVFSVLMTTGLLTTFQEKFAAHFIGIAIGLILSLISFIFWKIDERNKYLTKHGENAIKEIEKKYHFDIQFEDLNKLQIFSCEENTTCELKSTEGCLPFYRRQISHSKSFNIIFLVFFLIGIFGSIASAYYQLDRAKIVDTANRQKADQEALINQKLEETNRRLDELRLSCMENKLNLLNLNKSLIAPR